MAVAPVNGKVGPAISGAKGQKAQKGSIIVSQPSQSNPWGKVFSDPFGTLLRTGNNLFQSYLNLGGLVASRASQGINQATYGLGSGLTSALGSFGMGAAAGLPPSLKPSQIQMGFPQSNITSGGLSSGTFRPSGAAQIGQGKPFSFPSGGQIQPVVPVADPYSVGSASSALDQFLQSLQYSMTPQQPIQYYIPGGGQTAAGYSDYIDTGGGYAPVNYIPPSSYDEYGYDEEYNDEGDW